VPESWRILLCARALELELEAELETFEALTLLPPAVEDEDDDLEVAGAGEAVFGTGVRLGNWGCLVDEI
jgi:hypothetical protein